MPRRARFISTQPRRANYKSAEGRRKRKLETGQGINHGTLCPGTNYGVAQLAERLIEREVERADINHVELFFRNKLLERLAVGCRQKVIRRTFFKNGENSGFAASNSLHDKLIGEHGFTRARRARDQNRVTPRNTAARHQVQHGDAGREPVVERPCRRGALAWFEQPRENGNAVAGDPHRLKPRNLRLPAHFLNEQFPDDRVAVDVLA